MIFVIYSRDLLFFILFNYFVLCFTTALQSAAALHLNINRSPVIEGRGFHRRLVFNLNYAYTDTEMCPSNAANFGNLYAAPYFEPTNLLLEIVLTGQLYVLPSEIEALQLYPPNDAFKVISAQTVPPTHELEVEALAGPDYLNGGAKSSFDLYVMIAFDPKKSDFALSYNMTLSVPVHFRYGLPRDSGYLTILDVGQIHDAKLIRMGPAGDTCSLSKDPTLDCTLGNGTSLPKDPTLDCTLGNGTSLPKSVIIPVAIAWHKSFVGYATALTVWVGFGCILYTLVTTTKHQF